MPQRQRGQALIVITALLGITLFVTVYAITGSVNQTAIKDQKTADALAQAKAALIGYAVSNSVRPGQLPCPDMNDDGKSDSCSSAGNLGRLPLYDLGLPDLRDGSGEHLWYAVSSNFGTNPPSGEINSGTYGTITVRDSNGTIINDGSIPNSTTAAIAVVIAPGGPLTRQDGLAQARAGLGHTDPKNYLDIANGEDNAKFVDNNPDGFIQGEISDPNENVVLNDRLITITYGELMPLIEKRVAGEIKLALDNFYKENKVTLPYPNAADTSGSCPGGNDDGWLAVNPTSSSPPTTCAPSYPSWISNWNTIVRYHKESDDQVRLSFDPDPSKPTTCTGSFLITWQGTQGTIKRELPCVP